MKCVMISYMLSRVAERVRRQKSCPFSNSNLILSIHPAPFTGVAFGCVAFKFKFKPLHSSRPFHWRCPFWCVI